MKNGSIGPITTLLRIYTDSANTYDRVRESLDVSKSLAPWFGLDSNPLADLKGPTIVFTDYDGWIRIRSRGKRVKELASKDLLAIVIDIRSEKEEPDLTGIPTKQLGKVLIVYFGHENRILRALTRFSEPTYRSRTAGELLFSGLANVVPAMIWVSDELSDLIYVSQTLLEYSGATFESQLGKGWLSTVHPDDREYCEEATKRAWEARGPLEMEFRARRKDDVYRWFIARGDPIYDDDGQYLGHVGVCLDMTERKDAEQALQHIVDRYSALVQVTSAVVWSRSGKGGYLEPQTSWEIYTGYPWREDYAWVKAIHPEDRDRVWNTWQAALRSGNDYRCEYRLFHKASGEYHHVDSRGVALRNPDGSVHEWIGIIIDIEERMRAQEELRQSDARFRTTIENLDVGVIQAAVDGRMIVANKAFCKMLGYSQTEALARKLRDFFHPDDVQNHLQSHTDMIAGKMDTFTREVRLLKKDGSMVWAQHTCSLMRDAQGAPEYFIGLISDISERKSTEINLLALNDALEQKVMERTKAVVQFQEQLRQSERLASIGTLAAGIAHEINNPLNAILMNAEYALSATPEEKDRILKAISEEARRSGEIVNNILNFAREEQTAKTPGNINDVISRATYLAKIYIKSTSFEIINDLAPNLPLVLMSSTEMEQVVVNLFKNAVEAAADRFVTINVRSWSEDGQVCFEVRDNGPGMDKETLDQIFDLLFSTKKTRGGTGLGLNISHSIISDHGGTISVESEPGKGAAFTIRLPALLNEANTARSTAAVNSRL